MQHTNHQILNLGAQKDHGTTVGIANMRSDQTCHQYIIVSIAMSAIAYHAEHEKEHM